MQSYRLLILCTLLLCIEGVARAEVCRSAKYPTLIMDTRIIRNAEAFLDEAGQKNKVYVNNSFRSYEEQTELHRQWIARGKKGNPAARPGRSRHEAGFALDLNRLQELTFIQWHHLLNTGENYGFEYLLGDWPGEGTQKFDWPHFQASPVEYGVTFSEVFTENRVKRNSVKRCPWLPKVPNSVSEYVGQVLVTNFRLRPVISHGKRLAYVDARITNVGHRSIVGVELRAELYDSVSERTYIRFLHTGDDIRRGLKPGVSKSVQLPFGTDFDLLREGPLQMRVTYLEFL